MEIPARIAAFRANCADRYGVVTDAGIVDLTPEYGTRFKGLKEVIEAGALEELIAAAEGRGDPARAARLRDLLGSLPSD